MEDGDTSSRKRKLPNSRSPIQETIERLTSLTFTFTTAPPEFATQLISHLKPGPGLLGTPEEEAALVQASKKSSQSKKVASVNQNEADNEEIGSTGPRSNHRITSTQGVPDAADAEDVEMADVLGEAQQLSQDPPKVDKGKGRANTDEEEYNCSEVEGEDDDDYEPDAEEAAAELPGLERYKPRHKKTIHYNTLKEEDSEDDIMLGDYEEPHFGKDFVVVDDENVHITQAFGEEYIKLIHALHNIKALPQPPFMTLELHYYQLKGIAQIHHLCNSLFRGAVLADAMGLGKTIQAIHALYLAKDEPGFSLVVCPKSLCSQWVSTIEGAYEEGHGLSVYYLEGSSSITAHELLALGIDVVVCSYDQVDASERSMRNLSLEIEKFRHRKDQQSTLKQPIRPNAVLHSAFWQQLNLPIKRLVLDEAHLVNKRDGARHGALKNLFYLSAIVLSGTPAHNAWHDISGLIDFLQGHPFKDHQLFMKAFSSTDYEGRIGRPELHRMRALQRFIQAFTIARPATILKLTDCVRRAMHFHIRPTHASEIDILLLRYHQMMNIRKSRQLAEEKVAAALSCAVKAQLVSLHPMLYEDNGLETNDADNAFVDMDEENPVHGYIAADRASRPSEERSKWLQSVEARENLVDESDRLIYFLYVYQQLRRSRPDKKIIVFSQYLKFLDIIAEALRRVHKVEALRFDGKVNHTQRVKVQQDFKFADPRVPLLMTAAAGAYGLNVTAASIVIQCEIWWNISVEWQAICRVWRQLQEHDVLAIMLFATNSAIDLEILAVQARKADITNELMEAIIRGPDDEPDIRPLAYPPALSLTNYGPEHSHLDEDEIGDIDDYYVDQEGDGIEGSGGEEGSGEEEQDINGVDDED